MPQENTVMITTGAVDHDRLVEICIENLPAGSFAETTYSDEVSVSIDAVHIRMRLPELLAMLDGLAQTRDQLREFIEPTSPFGLVEEVKSWHGRGPFG